MSDAGIRAFIDVDGVINAYSGKPHVPSWGWPRESAKLVHVMTFLIVYSPEMLARLRDLTDRDDVEPCWLTTWTDNAVTDLAPAVGIGSDWQVCPRGMWDEEPWWKLDAMRQLNEGYEGKIIWVDDDIKFVPEAVDWIKHADLDILAISPRTETGITLAQMQRIEQYVAEEGR